MPRITIDTTEVRHCHGCGARPPTKLYRHHKGCDKLIGMYNRKVAKNYKKYLHCVDLCDPCHMKIHWWLKLKLLGFTRITTRTAKRIRKQLIALCDEWLKKPATERPLPPPDFVAHWKTQLEAWENKVRQQ